MRFLLACWLLLTPMVLAGPLTGDHAAWQTVGPGLRFLKSRWTRPDGSAFTLVAVQADETRYRLAVLSSKTRWRVDAMRHTSGAVVAINGPFFDTDLKPMGLIISKGRQLQPMPPPSAANGTVLCVRNGFIHIEPRTTFDPSNVTEAVQCAPRLIADAKPTTDILDGDVIAPRTVVSLQGHLVTFICTGGWLDLASLHDMQAVLQSPLFNSEDALALDGGASTQMSFQCGRFSTEIVARDPVPVGVGLVPARRQ